VCDTCTFDGFAPWWVFNYTALPDPDGDGAGHEQKRVYKDMETNVENKADEDNCFRSGANANRTRDEYALGSVHDIWYNREDYTDDLRFSEPNSGPFLVIFISFFVCSFIALVSAAVCFFFVRRGDKSGYGGEMIAMPAVDSSQAYAPQQSPPQQQMAYPQQAQPYPQQAQVQQGYPPQVAAQGQYPQ
jgi:hypothetical protein